MATLIASFGPNLEFARNTADLTSYRTGGPTRYFLSAHSASEVTRAIESATRFEIPFFVIGGGSNLLISDEGYDGLIIKVDVTGLSLISENSIACGAGEDLITLVNFATESSLTGIEFLAGIWGSVGGAIYGNAGAFGGEIGDVVSELTIVGNDGAVRVVPPDYCQFGYRDSYLKTTHEVVVGVRITLSRGKQKAIADRVHEILHLRESKHPTDALTAGCFFKNIPDPKEKFGKLPAGRLLEEIGAKSLRVGGAAVFDKHANIIVNNGTATSKDIRNLADILKARVRERFGIDLQEEVIQVGSF